MFVSYVFADFFAIRQPILSPEVPPNHVPPALPAERGSPGTRRWLAWRSELPNIDGRGW